MAWKCVKETLSLSDALPDKCIGARYEKAADGYVTIFAATKRGLYKLVGHAWEEVKQNG